MSAVRATKAAMPGAHKAEYAGDGHVVVVGDAQQVQLRPDGLAGLVLLVAELRCWCSVCRMPTIQPDNSGALGRDTKRSSLAGYDIKVKMGFNLSSLIISKDFILFVTLSRINIRYNDANTNIIIN